MADEVTIYDYSYENIEPKRLFQKLMKSSDEPRPEMIIWEVDDEEVAEWNRQHVINPLDKMGIPVVR